jgi:hypothetical protein
MDGPLVLSQVVEEIYEELDYGQGLFEVVNALYNYNSIKQFGSGNNGYNAQ